MNAARILIVDDDPDYRDLLAQALQRHGYITTFADDGKSAMDFVGQNPPDLLITDCFLPRMDGVHLCKFLRADARFRRLPMILISGVLDKEILAFCGEFGIDAAYEKSIDFQSFTKKLLREIARLLSTPSGS